MRGECPSYGKQTATALVCTVQEPKRQRSQEVREVPVLGTYLVDIAETKATEEKSQQVYTVENNSEHGTAPDAMVSPSGLPLLIEKRLELALRLGRSGRGVVIELVHQFTEHDVHQRERLLPRRDEASS